MDAQCDWCQPSRIRLLRVADEEVVPVTDWGFNRSPSWSPDGHILYFVSNRGGSRDLWQQRMSAAGLPEGDAQRVTVGVGMFGAALSPAGTSLAYVQGGPTSNLWRIPILEDRVADWGDVEQLTFDAALIHSEDISANGMRLVFASDRGGNQDLWTMPAAGGDMRQLTTDPGEEWTPKWSPDGQQVAFMRGDGAGGRDIWVMSGSDATARQLTKNVEASIPSWSPDGTEIVFRSTRLAIWVVNVETGDLRPLVELPGANDHPAWSPDGRCVIFSRDGQVWRIPSAGGEAEALTAAEGGLMWSPDSREVYFRRSQNYWALSLDDGSERQLTALGGRPGFTTDGNGKTDGRYLYFAWRADQGDIWVMDVVQGEANNH